MDSAIEHFRDWNQAQIIGLILSLGFLVGMIYAVVEAIVHRGGKT